jgi:hypothetical protein
MDYVEMDKTDLEDCYLESPPPPIEETNRDLD